MASRFRISAIHELGQPVSNFIRRYGYELRTLRRVEAGTARPDTIVRVERDFSEFATEVKAQESRREARA